jgi:glycosyltransferase involved in cell wall biosynthesis
LYVGRLSADKAVTDLIEALPEVDAHLVITGRGVKMAALKRRPAGGGGARDGAAAPGHRRRERFLYAPSDIGQLARCLCRVLRSPAESAKMGRASREIALAHDADLTVTQYEQTYRQASGQRLAD